MQGSSSSPQAPVFPDCPHHTENYPTQSALCSDCPCHVLTGPEASVPYTRFCQAFGFPVGPAGSRDLLVFYELWSSAGELVQRGRASGCPAQGTHPETLLFDPHTGYLCSVLEVCEEVSSILLFSNYPPCQEAARPCAQTLLSFLGRHPWVRLDLLFSQLRTPRTPAPAPAHPHPHPEEDQAGLLSLAAGWPRLSLSPVSGRVWGHLLRSFVSDAPPSALRRPLMAGRVEADWENAVRVCDVTGAGPSFLDLPPPGAENDTAGPPATTTARLPLILLPPPHLPPSRLAATQPGSRVPPLAPQLPQSPPAPPLQPINVVRHIRMPPPRRRGRPAPPSSSPPGPSSSPLGSLDLPGWPVEIVQVIEREVPDSSQSQHRDSKRSRTWKQNRRN